MRTGNRNRHGNIRWIGLRLASGRRGDLALQPRMVTGWRRHRLRARLVRRAPMRRRHRLRHARSPAPGDDSDRCARSCMAPEGAMKRVRCMRGNHQVFRRAIMLLRLATPVAMLVAATGIVAGCTDSTEPSQLNSWTLEAVTPTNLTGVVATDLSPPPTVRVRDQNGKPIGGIVVSFHAS